MRAIITGVFLQSLSAKRTADDWPDSLVHLSALLLALFCLCQTLVADEATDAGAEPVEQSAQTNRIEDLSAANPALIDARRHVNPLILKGDVLRDKGQFDQAEAAYQNALTLAEQTGQPGAIGVVYNAIGELEIRRGNIAEAEKLFRRSLELCIEADYPAGQATAYNDLGRVYTRYGRYDKAIEMHNRALTIANQTDDRSMACTAKGNMAAIYRRQGDYEKAEQLWSWALNESIRIRDIVGTVKHASDLANLYTILDKHKEAEQALLTALSLAEKAGLNRSVAEILLSLGSVYRERSDYTRAEPCLKRAKRLYEMMNYQEGIADVYIHLGNVYSEMGDIENAEQFYRQGLEIDRRLDLPTKTAISAYNLAHILIATQRFQECEELLLGVEQLVEETDDRVAVVSTAEQFVELYMAQDRPELAMAKFQEVLSTAEQLGNHWNAADLFDAAARAAAKLDDQSQSAGLFQRSLSISEKIGNDVNAMANLINLSQCYQSLQDTAKLIETYEKGYVVAMRLSDWQKMWAFAHERTLIAFNAEDDSIVAERWASRALAACRKLDDPHHLTLAYFNMADAQLRLDQHHEAERNYRAALRTLKDLKDQDEVRLHVETLLRLSITLQDLQRHADAEKYARQAYEITPRLPEDLEAKHRVDAALAIANCLYRQDRHLDAKPFIEEGMDRVAEHPEPGATRLYALRLRASILLELEEEKEVLLTCREGAALADELGRPSDQVQFHIFRSRSYSRRKVNNLALGWAKRAADLLPQVEDPFVHFKVHDQIANICYMMDRHQQCEKHARKAAELAIELKLNLDAAKIYHMLGQALDAQNRPQEAKEAQQLAMRYAQRTGQNWLLGMSQNAVGWIEYEQNNLEAAEQWYLRALKSYALADNDEDDEALAHINLANLRWKQGDLERARSRFEQATRIYEKLGQHERAAKFRDSYERRLIEKPE